VLQELVVVFQRFGIDTGDVLADAEQVVDIPGRPHTGPDEDLMSVIVQLLKHFLYVRPELSIESRQRKITIEEDIHTSHLSENSGRATPAVRALILGLESYFSP